MQRIEILPKDVVEKITNELSASDFVKFCTNNYSICNLNDVFKRRILRDFPFLKEMFDDWNTNSKIRYLETFTEISQEAERLTEKVINTFDNVAKYLSPEYRKDVYSYLFKVLTDSIQVVSDEVFDIEIIFEFLIEESYVGDFETKFVPPKSQDDGDHNNYFWSDLFTENVETFLHKFFND